MQLTDIDTIFLWQEKKFISIEVINDSEIIKPLIENHFFFITIAFNGYCYKIPYMSFDDWYLSKNDWNLEIVDRKRYRCDRFFKYIITGEWTNEVGIGTCAPYYPNKRCKCVRSPIQWK
ncbi:MAG: hypothetical protein M0P47_11170 [Bacteroidales bacterium]|nr:hypothetical protein [Bacteroidales bacterium]